MYGLTLNAIREGSPVEIAGIEAARAEVTAAVTANFTADRLAKAVNGVAHAEGYADALTTARYVLIHHADSDARTTAIALIDAMSDALTLGADDEWSGRANDVRRARFDGVRAAAKDVLRLAQREVTA